MDEYMKLLGLRVRDRVSGFAGVATSVCFDLYGCVQVTINPGLQQDGKLGEPYWFDAKRLEVTDPTPIMPRPEFVYNLQGAKAGSEKGPETKPAFGVLPRHE